MTHMPSPVRVTGHLDPGTSRWLWLVKWLLLIPHLVVVAVLAVAFWVLTVVAFVAILVTGRYPRVLFGFNLGVLRWGWRVVFYGYAANGTDRYPPFTLADVPDYPARLDIAYPEHLSRGLVLVKWWLLAIPHYLVLVFLIGAGGSTVARIGTTGSIGLDGGLVGLLVLVGVVALLFRGRYPAGLFDLVVGLDRWVLRVIAYAALMTDDYPPFRLDQGEEEPAPVDGPDPGTVPGDTAPPVGSGGAAVLDRPLAPPAPAVRTSVSPPGPGRSVLLVVGAVVAVAALAVVGVAGAGLAADRTGRDAAGFLNSGIGAGSTAGHALLTEPLRIEGVGATDALSRLVGDVRLAARSDDGGAIFVGIAPASDVVRYLDGVAVGVWRGEAAGGAGWIYETLGTAPPTPPAAQTFWVARASGTGEQTVEWTPRTGTWTAVVMNADGSAPVVADVRVGAQLPVLGLASGWVLGTGLAFLLVGVALILVGGRPQRAAAAV